MIDFLNNSASVNIEIPLEKIFEPDDIGYYQIEGLTWNLSIKPGIRNVSKYIDGRFRYEEIEVLSLELLDFPDKTGQFSLLRSIHSKIQYPCVVFFKYRNKYKIAAWKFVDSGKDNNQIILKSHYITSWIYDPPVSKNTLSCLTAIEHLLLQGEGDLRDLYNDICNVILNCYPQFIGSNKHLLTILYDLGGNKNDPLAKKIDRVKWKTVTNKKERYGKKDYGSFYKYAYEYEDIWYALMSDSKFSKIIEKRRYFSMEDLVYSIDSKYDSHPW